MVFVPDSLHGMSAEQLAEFAGVEVSTARRWRRSGRCPLAVSLLAGVLLAGDLGAIDPAWRGWRLTAGEVVSPEGWRAGPGDVLALPFLRA